MSLLGIRSRLKSVTYSRLRHHFVEEDENVVSVIVTISSAFSRPEQSISTWLCRETDRCLFYVFEFEDPPKENAVGDPN